MKTTILAAMSLTAVICLAHAGMAHAELAVWQVESNPPGTDHGNEWLTVVNTGGYDVFIGYDIRTTHGSTTHQTIPALGLDECEYYRIDFERQSLDNTRDTILLLRHDSVVSETPVIVDIKNDGNFWVNPDVACDDPQDGTAAGNGPLTEQEKDALINDLDRENGELKSAIESLRALLSDALDVIHGLFGASR